MRVAKGGRKREGLKMSGLYEGGDETLHEIVAFLEEMQAFLARVLDKLPEKDVTRRASDGEWSLLEHTCHLRDIEQEGYSVRIARILREENPFLPDIDGDRLAAERHYPSQDFTSALKSFTTARQANVRQLRDLSADQLRRTARFGDAGTITLLDLIKMMHEHDTEHRRQLTDLHNQLSSETERIDSGFDFQSGS